VCDRLRISATFVLSAVAILTWPASLAAGDDPKPSRETFIREVLDAKPTPLTPRFQAGEGYYVRKEDLMKGVIEEAAKRKLRLRGVLIVGPLPDGFWTYIIAAFLGEGDKVRVNLLIFPHARITYKATGLVTPADYDKWVAELQKAGILKKDPPEAARKEKDESRRENTFSLLLGTWGADGSSHRVFYAKAEDEAEERREEFGKALSGILNGLEATYDPRKE
jgi:hypothetical protein